MPFRAKDKPALREAPPAAPQPRAGGCLLRAEEDRDGEATPVRTLRVLAGRDLWGNRVGSDQPSAERQRSSSFTRILILIIATDSRTIHSEYVGKTTGPETMLAANRLVGSLLWGQKEQINQTVIFCLIFGQIYKSVSNRT